MEDFLLTRRGMIPTLGRVTRGNHTTGEIDSPGYDTYSGEIDSRESYPGEIASPGYDTYSVDSDSPGVSCPGEIDKFE